MNGWVFEGVIQECSLFILIFGVFLLVARLGWRFLSVFCENIVFSSFKRRFEAPGSMKEG